jgi:ribosomal protein S18 acetylase RimI-like enzyme
MHIRYYHPDDDAPLMELERRCPRGLPQPFIHYRRRFIDRAAIFSDFELLVAEHDRTVIGTVAVCVKRTRVGDRPVSMGYIFDARTDPAFRRRGIGQALVEAVDHYLIGREVDGVYGHILASNFPSLRLFAKMGYRRLRQLMMLMYPPIPLIDIPEWMPRHSDVHTAEHDVVQAVHSPRDLYIPDVAERVKTCGFQRWSLDLGNAHFAGMSLFDQSTVFQQWPADEPFPTEDEMKRLAKKSLRLFDEVGIHNAALLRTIFDTLRDQAVTDQVGKLTLLVDRMDRIPTFLYAEASLQLEYWMAFKPLKPDWTPDWQDAPIYVDAREL